MRKHSNFVSLLALCLGQALCLLTALGVATRAGSKQLPFHLYQWNPGGTIAAALAPDRSSVAVIIEKSPTGKPAPTWPWMRALQIWDFRNQKLLLERELKIWETQPRDKLDVTKSLFDSSLAYTPDGREMVYCDGTSAHVFDTKDYREIRTFSMTPEIPGGPLWEVEQISISRDGENIAVSETKLDKDFWPVDGVVLSVYSLDSGALDYTQNFESARTSGALAWSPDGEHLAITLSPFDVDDLDSLLKFSDVRIVKDGVVTVQIQSGYQQNWAHERLLTEDMARDVAFLKDGSLVTVAGEPALGPGRKDDLRVWDAATGKLLRQVPSPPNGVHLHLQVSWDGQTVLGYIGKDTTYWFDPASVKTIEQSFRLWDASTWQVLFTSPPIPLPQDAGLADQNIRFALSADGKLVMVWWAAGTAPIYIYERQ